MDIGVLASRPSHTWLNRIKEAISIRKTTPIMNRDEGRYRISQVGTTTKDVANTCT